MLRLRYDTPQEWKQIALNDLDTFLQDHAANERKVAHSALSLAVQHPHLVELVDALIDVANEEMEHFTAVYHLLKERDQTLGKDRPDPYMSALFKQMRRGDAQLFLLDRLLLFGIIEARGFERFFMMSEALPEGSLKVFYEELARSEARHHALYIRLAKKYFDADEAEARLDELLDFEARTLSNLPLSCGLH